MNHRESTEARFLFFFFLVPTWILWWLPVAFLISPRSVTGAIDNNATMLVSLVAHVVTCFILINLDNKDSDKAEKKAIEQARVQQERLAKKKEWRPAQSKSNT